MSDIDDDVAQSVKASIWSGFYSRLEVREMAHELVEDESQVDATDFFINAEWSAKRKAERGWPSETDCDRLEKVWEALGNAGFKVDWNGNRDTKILIRGLEWRKRGPA